MKDNPIISVIIPVYNAGQHLYRCLDSIINQTYRNLEIIIVDDGSTDGSDKVCDEYRKKDERIRVIHQENSGVSRARNVGLEQATGDYVNFPDSDDYIDADTYETLLDAIRREDAEAVCFEYYVTYSNKETQHKARKNNYGAFDTEGAIYELLFCDNFLCNKLLPMNAIKNLHFLENIYRDEDTIFCMMALHNVRRTVFIEKTMYHYVQSEDSACRGVFRPNQLSAIDAIPIMEDFLGKHYPHMLRKWRSNYMHLMIMLYADMDADELGYKAEKKRVYNTYKQLKKGIRLSDIHSMKNLIKFETFSVSPTLFCAIHKITLMKNGGR